MIHQCGNCGAETDTCYTDSGVLGMVHGQCLCRKCYIADGHPECPKCGETTAEKWRYCPWCGAKLTEKGGDA